MGAGVAHDQGVECVGVGVPAREDHEAEVPEGAGQVGSAAEGADEDIVGDARGGRRRVEMHVSEEAEDERGECEAGEVGEERAEGAVEEGAERGRGEGVEAEEDWEGKAEKMAGGRRGAGGRGGETNREWDVGHLGEGRSKESREMRQGGV